MKCTKWLGIAALTLAACSTDEAANPSQDASQPGGLDVPALPTQDEADAQAQQAIDAKNAEAEFEKLKKELEGG